MTIHNNLRGKGETRRNTAEGQCEDSPERKKGKFASFMKESLGVMKRSARVIGFAVGMTLVVAACGNDNKPVGDTNVDGDVPADVTDADTYDGTDVGPDGSCVGPGEPLAGEVNPEIAKTRNWDASFNGEGITSGSATFTIGADLDGDYVMLGDCGDGVKAALAVQDDSISAEPQARLDYNPETGEITYTGGENLCEPLSSADNTVSASLFNTYANLTRRNITVGGETAPVELGFTDSLAPVLLVNGSEVSSANVLIDGRDFSLKTLTVMIPEENLKLAVNLYSNSGLELLSGVLEGTLSATIFGEDVLNSQELRIFQIGSGNSLLPSAEFDTSLDAYLCIRCEPQEETRTMNITITVPVTDEKCGPIHGGYTVESLSGTIVRVVPDHLFSDFSISDVTATSLEPLQDASLAPQSVSVTLLRTPGIYDTGERIDIIVEISGTMRSVLVNPETGMRDLYIFSIEKTYRDADAWLEYSSICSGCEPQGVRP